jgi:hypothetical protein
MKDRIEDAQIFIVEKMNSNGVDYEKVFKEITIAHIE